MAAKITTEIFIARSKIIHGNKFDYSKSIYVAAHNKLIILCNKCGVEFNQSPNGHLKGNGCSNCYILSQTKTFESFLNDAMKVHGNKFDYSLANFKTNNIKISIICNNDHVFNQIPFNHLKGEGCPYCSGRFVKTQDQFVKHANKIHNNKYSYGKYIGAKSLMIINCPKHGEFKQKANNHLNGSGCPRCCNLISKQEFLWLNFLNIPNDKEHRQVALKINNKNFKVDGFDPTTNTVYEFNGDYWHGNPKIYKQNDYNSESKVTFGELYNRTIAKENILKAAGYNIVSIWESDWKNIK